jgi:hypothetical protein
LTVEQSNFRDKGAGGGVWGRRRGPPIERKVDCSTITEWSTFRDNGAGVGEGRDGRW